MQRLQISASDSVCPKLPALVDAVSTFGTLQYLDLSGNNLGPEEARIVADAISVAASLQVVDLSNNSISTGWVEGKMYWGDKRGPQIEVLADGRTAVDVAVNPVTGDDGKGRYRNIIAEDGFASGVHRWSIRLKSCGRLLAGVATSAVDGTWRDVWRFEETWSVVLESGSLFAAGSSWQRGTNKWHAGTRAGTGLPLLHVNGCLECILDCDRHSITFRIDGNSGDKETTGGNVFTLPQNKTFYPLVALGGDDLPASVELCDYRRIDVIMEGVDALARACQRAKQLTCLDVSNNNLGSEAKERLCNANPAVLIKL